MSHDQATGDRTGRPGPVAFISRTTQLLRRRADWFWRLAARMRTRSWVLPRGPGLRHALGALWHALGGRGARLEAKVDRLLDQTQFLQRRMTTYLGDGIALTFLADETPFFINSNDFGGPMTYADGGVYEPQNLGVLLSYVTPATVFVDVGANLGFFAVKVARRLRAPGRVFAFEPHPFLHDLMSRTIYVNQLRDMVTVVNGGLSDHEGPAEFQFPLGHLGGGSVTSGPASGVTRVQSTLQTLDQALPPDTVVNLAKIDVEGHELQVLRGMTATIAASPSIIILFEKLIPSSGDERAIADLLGSFGHELFTVELNRTLRPISVDELEAFGRGYVVSGRPEAIGPLNRCRFSIYPEQLFIAAPHVPAPGGVAMTATAGAPLFHGPYWFLERGFWECCVDGAIDGRATMMIAERFGRPVVEFELTAEGTRSFYVDHDLVQFECIARATTPTTAVTLRRLEFRQVSERTMFETLWRRETS